jgi:hypothetical protein
MSIELKVKSKHLSEEARIIRFEERKLFKQYHWGLRNYRAAGNNDMYPRWEDKAFMSYASLNRHRKWDVRNENRATFLARAFIAGVPYSSVEQKRKPENERTFNFYVLPRVIAMVVKYGRHTCEKGDYEWETRAPRHGRYKATDQLKQKIVEWTQSEIKPENFHIFNS